MTKFQNDMVLVPSFKFKNENKKHFSLLKFEHQYIFHHISTLNYLFQLFMTTFFYTKIKFKISLHFHRKLISKH